MSDIGQREPCVHGHAKSYSDRIMTRMAADAAQSRWDEDCGAEVGQIRNCSAGVPAAAVIDVPEDEGDGPNRRLANLKSKQSQWHSNHGRLYDAPLFANEWTILSPSIACSSGWERIVFTVDGWAQIEGAERRVPLTRGSILTIPAGATPRLEPYGLLRTITLLVDPGYLAEQLRWLPLHHPLVHHLYRNVQNASTLGRLDLPSTAMDALSPALLRIVRLSGAETRQFALLASASEVFDIISRTSGSTTIKASENRRLPRREIAAAMRLLRSHPNRAWTVNALAREVLISPSQLTRIFRADLGVSPSTYLRQVRTDRMAELLSTTTIGVSEAAQQAGWSNPTVASRAFKKRYGVSPKSFAGMHPEVRRQSVA